MLRLEVAATTTRSVDELLRENERLRRRCEENDDALRALRAGEVDAILVESGREQVYTLEAVERPYRLLVERMFQGAATLTEDGAILYCNATFAELVGRPQESLPGRALADLVTPESHAPLATLLREGRTAEMCRDIALARADGRPATAYLCARALVEGALGVCLLVTDRTEQRHYQELRRTQEALKASEEVLHVADRRKDEFLATLAHELRNPLAPIRNAAEILKANPSLDPQVVWCRDVINRQVLQMARLLEDLLDVSRISRNMLELRKETVELAVVVEVALETSRPLIAAGGHELVVELPEEPTLLRADPLRLEQVLSNLLNNAAKYSETGGRIELVAVREGADLVITVRDNGMGLATQAIPEIFEMFSQAKSAQARSQGGLGVGLALVRGLVALHGGTVEARSAGPGKGSEFVVRAPIVVDRPDREVRPRAAEPSLQRFRMLVVDDNVDSADTLASLLRVLGNEVDVAYDGEQAIAAVAATRPEVVLLDIGMPRLDGYETCRRIRTRPQGHEPYVIALTGWGQEEDRRRTAEAGFDEHIVKPVDTAELLELLAAARPR